MCTCYIGTSSQHLVLVYVCCLEWDVECHVWDVVNVCLHVHEHLQLLYMCTAEWYVEC